MNSRFSLYFGPGTYRKAEDLLSGFKEGYRKGLASEFVVIVPTRRFATDLKRQFHINAPQRWESPPVFAIYDFFDRFTPATEKEISIRDTSWILRNLINDHSEDFSRFFSRVDEPFASIATTTASAVLQLKENSISPGNIPSSPDSDLSVFCKLYTEYEESLDNNNLIDESDARRYSLDYIRQNGLGHVFPKLKSMLFYGLDEFSGLLIDLLEYLSTQTVDISVMLEYERGRPRIFGHIDSAFQKLSQLADNIEFCDEYLENDSRKCLVESVYSENPQDHDDIDTDDFLEIHSLPDRYREVEYIAGEVKKLLIDFPDDQKPSQLFEICICFPSLEIYAPLVREIFDDYGIPFNISAGFPLTRAHLVKALDLLIRVIENDFEKTDLLRFLQSPYFDFTTFLSEKENISISGIVEILSGMRIASGGEQWIIGMERQVLAQQKKIDDIKSGVYSPEDENGEPGVLMKKYSVSAAKYQSALDLIKSLSNLFEPFRKKTRFQNHSETLLHVIKELGLLDQIMPSFKSRGGIGILRRDAAAWEPFRDLLEETASLESDVLKNSRTFAEFASELRFLLSLSQYRPEEINKDAVQVLGRLEPRLYSFSHFFLGGFLENEFPPVTRAPFFSTGEDARNVPLFLNPVDASADRYLFYHYLRRTRSRFMITYPASQSGNPMIPSPMLREISRCFGLNRSEMVKSGYEKKQIYSETDLQKNIGERSARQDCKDELEELWRIYEILPGKKSNTEICINAIESSRLDPEVRVSPDDDLFQKNVYSVSQLETYGNCPFQYYVERILRLSEPEELPEEMTALERGGLIHKILFKFYTERKAKENLPIDSDMEEESARKRIREIAEEEMSHFPYDDIFWENEKERITGYDGPEGRDGILGGFISNERKYFDSGPVFLPEFFEAGFGRLPRQLGDKDSISTTRYYIIPHPEGEIRLRGKVDRVEILGDHFAVVDYKTGSAKKIGDLEDGKSLQLPVYLLAMKDLLERNYEKEFHPAGGIFYVLKTENNINRAPQIFLKDRKKELGAARKRSGAMESEEELNDIIRIALNFISDYITVIRKGHFPFSRFSDEFISPCRYCPWNTACRK